MFEPYTQGYNDSAFGSPTLGSDSHRDSHNLEQPLYTEPGIPALSASSLNSDHWDYVQNKACQLGAQKMATTNDSSCMFVSNGGNCWSCGDIMNEGPPERSMGQETMQTVPCDIEFSSVNPSSVVQRPSEYNSPSSLTNNEWLDHFACATEEKLGDGSLNVEDDWSFNHFGANTCDEIEEELKADSLGLESLSGNSSHHISCIPKQELEQQCFQDSSSIYNSQESARACDIGSSKQRYRMMFSPPSILRPGALEDDLGHRSSISEFHGPIAPDKIAFPAAADLRHVADANGTYASSDDLLLGIGLGVAASDTSLIHHLDEDLQVDSRYDGQNSMHDGLWPSSDELENRSWLSSRLNNSHETSSSTQMRGGHNEEIPPCLHQTDTYTRGRPQGRVYGGGRDTSKDEWLVQLRLAGKQYSDIKRICGFQEAESTLRGRFRMLMKPKEARVRKPVWTDVDIKVLKETVDQYLRSSIGGLSAFTTHSLRHGDRVQSHVLSRIPWKQIAEQMASRGCYRYGNATVKKKYLEILGSGSSFISV